ncbi:MAG TPA: hypothetical protein PLI53_05655 [Geobacteraceae bacterium]|nr:hypothetical protein [Geobacteraceae bacterium]
MNVAAILKVRSVLGATAASCWSYRKYYYAALGFLVFFLAFHLVTWLGFTRDLLTDRYDGGDLSRLGYLPGSKHYRKTFVDLPKRHQEMRDYKGQKIDMLTIGDSFSFGGGRGKNPFYQDYIASINDITVLNATPYPADDLVMGCSPLSTLAVLDNSGYLDIIKPRYVLIESLETLVPARFGRPFGWGWTDSLPNVIRHYDGVKDVWSKLPKHTFVNDGNFDFYWRNLMYCFSDSAFGHSVHRFSLKRPLFSVRKDDELLVFQYDIRITPYMTAQKINEVNDTMNRIAEALKRKGIRLIFMPVVSKYDLYEEDIVDNPYPKCLFFERLRPLRKKYLFIDTKAILKEELRKAEKDIFFADDTHWSWKASQAVFDKVRFPKGTPGG